MARLPSTVLPGTLPSFVLALTPAAAGVTFTYDWLQALAPCKTTAASAIRTTLGTRFMGTSLISDPLTRGWVAAEGSDK